MLKKERPLCLYCNKPCNRHTSKYCSRICMNKYFKELGIHYGGPKRRLLDKICLECGSVFRPVYNRNKFCCHRCSGLFQWKNGETLWNEKGIERSRNPTLIMQHNQSISASKRCNITQFSNHCSGYREDLKHFVRSTWEANICRLLCWYGISYKYEPEVFVLEKEDGKIISYKPDIKVGNYFIEIKGWETSKSNLIKKLFKQQYPTIRIEYINEDMYKEIEFLFGLLIPNWEFGRKEISEISKLILSHMEEGKLYSCYELSKLTNIPTKKLSRPLQTLKRAYIICSNKKRWQLNLNRKEVFYEDAI